MAIDLSLLVEVVAGSAVQPIAGKIDQSETILKTLKRLGLDKTPDHDDFDTIYAHSLVQYGVFKPKAVLLLFRDEYVKDAFKRTFYEGISSPVQRELSDLVQRLQEMEGSFQSIDVKKEIAEFTATFRALVSQTRTPSAAEMAQQISQINESHRILFDIVTGLSEQLKQSQSLCAEAMMSASSGDKLTFVETPHVAPPPAPAAESPLRVPSESDIEDVVRHSVDILVQQYDVESQIRNIIMSVPTGNIVLGGILAVLDELDFPIYVRYRLIHYVDLDELVGNILDFFQCSFDVNAAKTSLTRVVRARMNSNRIVEELKLMIDSEATKGADKETLTSLIQGAIERSIDIQQFKQDSAVAFADGLPDPHLQAIEIGNIFQAGLVQAARRLSAESA